MKGGPVNAFTLPGGILVFYSDLIDLARDGNEVAGVLAHEMGHVTHYHAIKGLARQFGVEQLLKSMTGGFSDLGTVGAGGSLLLALRNGRGFERDADATAVELLEKLGLRADGVSRFFERMLEKQPVDMASVIGIWSSHPPTAERIAATRRPATGAARFQRCAMGGAAVGLRTQGADSGTRSAQGEAIYSNAANESPLSTQPTQPLSSCSDRTVAVHRALGVIAPVLVSLFLIQLMSDMLYVRAGGYQPDTTRARRTIFPPAPVHEVDREASAGAINT